MWTHEESIETSASPATVWKLFADVARWKDWNAGIEAIEMHGSKGHILHYEAAWPGCSHEHFDRGETQRKLH